MVLILQEQRQDHHNEDHLDSSSVASSTTATSDFHLLGAEENEREEEQVIAQDKIERVRSDSWVSLLTMGLSTTSSSTETVAVSNKQQLNEPAPAPLPEAASSVEESETTSRADLLPLVLDAIQSKEWTHVLDLLEQDPSLAKRQVSMVCQGENSKCLLVHLICTFVDTPVSVVDALVTLHPASLLQTDKRGHRLPLHLAVLTGCTDAVIVYLCRARPQALKEADQEGNFPLHYAAMYGSEAVLRLFVETYGHACRMINGRERLPVHLLCARCYDESSLSGCLSILVEAHPQGLQVEDRFGRMPLHLAVQVPQMQWDFLKLLVDTCPKALVHKDKSRQIPLQLARKTLYCNKSNILLAALEDVTVKERKRLHPYRPFAGIVFNKHRSHRKQSNADLYHCYG